MAIIFPILFAENLPPWQYALASVQTTTGQRTEQKHANNHHHAKLTQMYNNDACYRTIDNW